MGQQRKSLDYSITLSAFGGEIIRQNGRFFRAAAPWLRYSGHFPD
jgi:hypothetical protein